MNIQGFTCLSVGKSILHKTLRPIGCLFVEVLMQFLLPLNRGNFQSELFLFLNQNGTISKNPDFLFLFWGTSVFSKYLFRLRIHSLRKFINYKMCQCNTCTARTGHHIYWEIPLWQMKQNLKLVHTHMLTSTVSHAAICINSDERRWGLQGAERPLCVHANVWIAAVNALSPPLVSLQGSAGSRLSML